MRIISHKEVNMPAYILAALTILFCMIAVWASVTQESDSSMMGEDEPDWGLEPLEQPKDYRKTG
jgi:hypothetical protein